MSIDHAKPLDEKSFNELLKEAGLKKSALADILDLDKATISRWGERVPKYAIVFLEERIDRVKLQRAVEALTACIEAKLF